MVNEMGYEVKQETPELLSNQIDYDTSHKTDDKEIDNNYQEDSELFRKISSWHKEAELFRNQYDQRWAKNLKLSKGILNEDEATKSRVRNRSKIFFRKTWATVWRITASLYSAYLRDPDGFKIEGREGEDVSKARVLQIMTEYRRDLLFKRKSQFLKFIWAFLNILDYGVAVGKWQWKYNKEAGIDEPDFMLYPIEQVYMDLTAETKEDMQYIIFENYMIYDDMEALGYEGIKDLKPETMSSNPLRNARYRNQTDPLQNPGEDEYPSPGSYEDGRVESLKKGRYKVWEVFYRDKQGIKFCVAHPNTQKILKRPIPSPYGRRYPVTIGTCLTEAHKIIGEGLHEALEGPQESFNANLNMRKDNVALALNKMSVVSRFGNVDLQSLTNSRPGGIVLADDIGAVREIDHRDVTQSAYAEAASDEAMMEEMSGVTPSKQGMGTESKATVAQINYAEGNAKIDLFLAIIGETFVKDWYDTLIYLIQRFETDEKVFRVANSKMQREYPYIKKAVVVIDDFEADCILNVGVGQAGRQMEIQQILLAMDRANISNQATLGIVGTGIIDPRGIKFFDTSKFMEILLPKLGHKNIKDFFLTVTPMPQTNPAAVGGETMGGGGEMGAGMRGMLQPQVGNMNKPMPSGFSSTGGNA